MPTRFSPVLRCTGAISACVLLGVGLAAWPSTLVSATEPVLTTSQVAALHDQMTGLGIDATVQSTLITKIEAGALPDSALSTSQPTSVLNDPVAQKTVAIFADGSRRVTSAEGPDSGQPSIESSKSGCVSSGGWYTNCTISISDIFSNASFVVDYQTSSSGKAKVRDVRGARCANTIGGCSVSASIKRSAQSSAGPAWAELAYKADVVHIGSGVSGSFGIRVAGTSVSLYG